MYYLLIIQIFLANIAKLKAFVDLTSGDIVFLVGASFFVLLLVATAIYMFKKFGLM
jgi:hypothetical protein